MEQPKLQDIEIEIPKKGNIVTGKFLRKDNEYIYILILDINLKEEQILKNLINQN